MAVRTDLAQDIVDKLECTQEVRGEWVQTGEFSFCNGILYTIKIKSKEGESIIGKPKGTYFTAKFPSSLADVLYSGESLPFLSNKLRCLLNGAHRVLVVCLGNRNITPDAVGPLTAGRILATRHIDDNLQKQLGLNLRPVAVISPGVLGQTGLEVQEIVQGVLARTKFDVVIAVDALASDTVSRLGTTLQMCDTGISPGSGVQNARAELSQNTLGVPVIAIGIPTVTDMEGAPFMVTPRDIDNLVDRAASLTAKVINMALFDKLSLHEIEVLMA